MIRSKVHLHNCSGVVLHTYPYQNSSLIVVFFLKNYGKVSAVAKGVKEKKRIYNKLSLLQPFQKIRVSLSGKQELLLLNNIETADTCWNLSGKSLYCSYYLNELLLRLLPSDIDCSKLFWLYNKILDIFISDDNSLEAALRLFELELLEFLGYGLNLEHDIDSGSPIDEHKNYYYFMASGASTKTKSNSKSLPIYGKTLVDLAQRQFSDRKTLQQSKRLLKWTLAEYLGDKPLKSREIFKQLYAVN